jgi:hypothetical protein
MANSKTNLTINELDFDNIKNNLKTYLQGQTYFVDYNFEGAGMNILLDVLAYNTHYEAFYNNMIANEMFLDSAVDRDNLVSIAKHLGYTPTSTRGAEASVSITLGSTAGYDGSYYLPRGEVITALKDGDTYLFVVKNPVPIDLTAADGYHFSNVTLQQGRIRSASFLYDSRDLAKKMIIPDRGVDTTTIRVRVQANASDDFGYSDSWDLAPNFNNITSTTKAYFLQESKEEKYEIYFGDGVIGKSLADGNLVVVSYLITDGEDANGIGSRDNSTVRSFSYGSGNTVIVIDESSGGSNRESAASIRFRAPLGYQAQNRAVTTRDYQSILVADYPDIESVAIWGGEDSDPPDFGSVVISFKPQSGLIITKSRKEGITKSLLESKNIVGIRAKIVDPDYTYVRVLSNISYNSDTVSLSDGALKNMVKNSIISWADENLEKFVKGLRYSKFVKMIDNSNPSILGNETYITMEKRYSPNNNINQGFKMNFFNEINHPHQGHVAGEVRSTKFEISTLGKTKIAFVEDDGSGAMRLMEFINGDSVLIDSNIGTVDYIKGTVDVSGLNIKRGTDYEEIRVRANPKYRDIDSSRNSILVIDPNDSSAITLTSEASTTGY